MGGIGYSCHHQALGIPTDTAIEQSELKSMQTVHFGAQTHIEPTTKQGIMVVVQPDSYAGQSVTGGFLHGLGPK